MSADPVELRLGGRRYGGWKRVQLSHSIDTVAGGFEVEVSERWPGQPTAREIRKGDEVDVLVGGDLVLSGYVDADTIELTKQSHSVTIRGRDRTGDLVDCSAVHEPGEWSGRTPEQIAADLCAPFGITVTVAVPTGGPLPFFKLEEGETVFTALERMARMRGFLLQPLPTEGGLLLASVGVGRSAERIREGAANVVSWSLQGSMTDRFSQYTVKGQQRGNDDVSGADAAEPAAESKDPGVPRYRPLVVIAEDQVDLATAQTRAHWEASTRAGRADEPSVTLYGFRDAAGVLWQTNTLVYVESPSLHVRRELLISRVSRVRDSQGSRTELGLMRPEAFVPEPLPETSEEGGLWD